MSEKKNAQNVTVPAGWATVLKTAAQPSKAERAAGMIGSKYDGSERSAVVGAMLATATLFAAGGTTTVTDDKGKTREAKVSARNLANTFGRSSATVGMWAIGGSALYLGVSEDVVLSAYRYGVLRREALESQDPGKATAILKRLIADKAESYRSNGSRKGSPNKGSKGSKGSKDEPEAPAVGTLTAAKGKAVTASNVAQTVEEALAQALTPERIGRMSKAQRQSLRDTLAGYVDTLDKTLAASKAA